MVAGTTGDHRIVAKLLWHRMKPFGRRWKYHRRLAMRALSILMLICVPSLSGERFVGELASVVVDDCQTCTNTGEVPCAACAKTTCTWSGEGKLSALFC